MAVEKQTVTMKSIGLVKVGGVLAILTGVVFIAMRLTGLFGIENFDTTAQTLLYIADHLPVYLTQQSFMMLTFLLVVPAALGFYRVLRPAGSVAVFATVAVMVGALIGIDGTLRVMRVWMELSPAYADADATARPTLEVMYRTLTGGVSHQVGWALISGIGVGLFSVAILRTALLPKWIAWLGLFAALAGWLHLLTAVWDTRLLHEIKFDSFNLWVLVIGVALLRLRGSVSSAHEE